VFTARYGLIPYIKQITFSLLKVEAFEVGILHDALGSLLNSCLGRVSCLRHTAPLSLREQQTRNGSLSVPGLFTTANV
jgi:hypothetical protein